MPLRNWIPTSEYPSVRPSHTLTRGYHVSHKLGGTSSFCVVSPYCALLCLVLLLKRGSATWLAVPSLLARVGGTPRAPLDRLDALLGHDICYRFRPLNRA